jgi:hypothetical protein
MHTIEITHNRGTPIIAGGATLDHIYATLSCLRNPSERLEPADRITLGVHGASLPVLANHGSCEVSWLNDHLLQVGDVVIFSLHEGSEPSRAIPQPVHMNKDSDERMFFEICKRVYFVLRAEHEHLEGANDDWVKDRD